MYSKCLISCTLNMKTTQVDSSRCQTCSFLDVNTSRKKSSYKKPHQKEQKDDLSADEA